MTDRKTSPDNVCIIDLTECTALDKTDVQKSSLAGVRKRLPRRTPSAKKSKTESSGGVAVAVAASEDCKLAPPSDDGDDDDDVVVLDQQEAQNLFYAPATAAASTVASATTIANAATRDDDVMLVGTKNQVSLPHMRPHCTNQPFQNKAGYIAAARTVKNMQYCGNCYCYVCDSLVPQCKAWTTHCHATDQGPRAYYWKQERQKAKSNKGSPHSSKYENDTVSEVARASVQRRRIVGAHRQTTTIPSSADQRAAIVALRLAAGFTGEPLVPLSEQPRRMDARQRMLAIHRSQQNSRIDFGPAFGAQGRREAALLDTQRAKQR